MHRLKLVVCFIYKVNVWFHCTNASNFALLFSLWPAGIILKRVQHALINHICKKWNIHQFIQRILSKYHLILSNDILMIFWYNPLRICLTHLHLIFHTKTLLQTNIFKVSLLKNLCILFLKLELINFVIILEHTSSLFVKFL